jgi:hypothetical protein
MSRVMFVVSVLSTLVILAVLVLAVISFTGGFVNPYMDPGM